MDTVKISDSVLLSFVQDSVESGGITGTPQSFIETIGVNRYGVYGIDKNKIRSIINKMVKSDDIAVHNLTRFDVNRISSGRRAIK